MQLEASRGLLLENKFPTSFSYSVNHAVGWMEREEPSLFCSEHLTRSRLSGLEGPSETAVQGMGVPDDMYFLARQFNAIKGHHHD